MCELDRQTRITHKTLLIVGTHDPLCNSGLAVVNREFQRQKMKIPAGEKIFSPDGNYFSPNENKITPRVFPNNPGLLNNKRALFENKRSLFRNNPWLLNNMRAIDDDPNGQLNKKIFFRDFAAMLPRIF
jgi:hypothetical protein